MRLQLVGFLKKITGPLFFLILVAAAAHFFELFALRSFESEVTLEAKATGHSTPVAVAKQRCSTNPESLGRRTLRCIRLFILQTKPQYLLETP